MDTNPPCMCTSGSSRTSRFGFRFVKKADFKGRPPAILLNKPEDPSTPQSSFLSRQQPAARQALPPFNPFRPAGQPGGFNPFQPMPMAAPAPTALFAALLPHEVAATVLDADMALFLAEQNDARELHAATRELCQLENMSWADAFGSVAKKMEPSIDQQHSVLKKWWAMHVLVEQMCPLELMGGPPQPPLDILGPAGSGEQSSEEPSSSAATSM